MKPHPQAVSTNIFTQLNYTHSCIHKVQTLGGRGPLLQRVRHRRERGTQRFQISYFTIKNIRGYPGICSEIVFKKCYLIIASSSFLLDGPLLNSTLQSCDPLASLQVRITYQVSPSRNQNSKGRTLHFSFLSSPVTCQPGAPCSSG